MFATLEWKIMVFLIFLVILASLFNHAHLTLKEILCSFVFKSDWFVLWSFKNCTSLRKILISRLQRIVLVLRWNYFQSILTGLRFFHFYFSSIFISIRIRFWWIFGCGCSSYSSFLSFFLFFFLSLNYLPIIKRLPSSVKKLANLIFSNITLFQSCKIAQQSLASFIFFKIFIFFYSFMIWFCCLARYSVAKLVSRYHWVRSLLHIISICGKSWLIRKAQSTVHTCMKFGGSYSPLPFWAWVLSRHNHDSSSLVFSNSNRCCRTPLSSEQQIFWLIDSWSLFSVKWPKTILLIFKSMHSFYKLRAVISRVFQKILSDGPFWQEMI
jgi:hypothetical protein